MSFFKRFLDDHPEAGSRDQVQREALVDLLTWLMFIDKYIALPEQEFIENGINVQNWHSLTPFDQFIQESITRARKVISNEGRTAGYLADIRTRLGDASARLAAYDACVALAAADGDEVAAESAFIANVARAFSVC